MKLRSYRNRARLLVNSGLILNSRTRHRARERSVKPLTRFDPTRTGKLRQAFTRELKRRFGLIRAAIYDLVVRQDAFGLNKPSIVGIVNSSSYFSECPRHDHLLRMSEDTKYTANASPWAFRSDPEKVKAFLRWLKQLYQQMLFDGLENEELADEEDTYWYRFVDQGFRQGAGKAWSDYVKNHPEIKRQTLDFYNSTRDQFLKSSFAQPESIDKIKLLAGRVYTDLKNITEDMSAKIVRELTTGLARGEHPNAIGKRINEVTDLGEARSKVVARHEIASAHSEGQLLAFEQLGVEELGVAVEWSTSGREKCSQLPKGADKRGCVCPICEALEGIIVKTSEAHGMLPAHVGCYCSWIPAGVGESPAKQKRSYEDVKAATEEAEELGGKEWNLDEDRPEPIIEPTGNFDPNQPRDEQGRWSSEGETVGTGSTTGYSGIYSRAELAYNALMEQAEYERLLRLAWL